jgi:spore germination protein
MNYTDSALQKHEIWFEDARSHYFKYQLAKDYGLRGVFFWALNIPFPQTWYILNDFFSITKLA